MHILTVAHNHSSFHPGGTETVAESLTEEFSKREDCTAAHLAGVDSVYRRSHAGTFLQGLPGHPEVTLFRSLGFDVFNQTQSRFDALLFDLSWYLSEQKPDVVHLHHLIHFGVELPVLIKKLLPDCKVVMTLHDYYLICPNDGLMVKTQDDELCHGASPDACHRCFPERPEMVFQVRKRNILNHLDCVDMFVAPSKFLRGRFVEWGIPRNRIKVIPNGRPWPAPAPSRSNAKVETPSGKRFGVFGNLRRTKGTLVAAEAAARLVETGFTDFSLDFFGEAFFQPDSFKDELASIVARSQGRIRVHGRFDIAQLPALMARVDWVVMPSTWWENAPIAIQDAFAHGRPVITSDIGGMAEAVTDGVDGLHVRVGDISHWMERLERAAASPDLWNKLRAGVQPAWTVQQTADGYLGIFQKLLSQGAGKSDTRANRAS